MADKDLLNNIGLSELHWAVIDKNYELLEKRLSEIKPSEQGKTAEMLYTGHNEKRDSRIFTAGDFFFPPSKVNNFPLTLNFDKGTYPIHLAAAMGDVGAIALFVKYKSNLNVKDGIGATPLHLACFYGHLESAKLLYSPKTKLDEATKTKKSLIFYDAGTTALHAALASGNIDLVQWLIDNGADIQLKTKYGCDAYFFAARSGNAKIIQLLAAMGLQLPAVGVYGNFPLLEAVKQNSYEAVAALLALSSPVKEPQGHQAPLLEAIKKNYLPIRAVLLEHGAQLPNYDGNLSRAARNNDTSYINEYYQSKKDLNIVTDRSTALMMAAAHGCMEAVQLLIDLGVDINVNPDGTALHWALDNNYYDIALLLLKHKADCSLVNEHGNSVLFYVLTSKIPDKLAVCKQMMALGANPHSKSRHGVSAYSLAQSYEDSELLALFDGISVEGANDLSYVAPSVSTVLQNLKADYNWKTVYNELWEELVPPRGNANSLQGELLRYIGKLSDEFFRNGNINWDENKANYLEMIAFLKKYLLDGSIAIEESKLRNALQQLTHFNVMHYDKNLSPHSLIAEAVVHWCVAHQELMELKDSVA